MCVSAGQVVRLEGDRELASFVFQAPRGSWVDVLRAMLVLVSSVSLLTCAVLYAIMGLPSAPFLAPSPRGCTITHPRNSH